MSRDKPHEFVKVYRACLPKEFVFENLVSEFDHDELRRMLENPFGSSCARNTVLSLPNTAMIEHAN